MNQIQNAMMLQTVSSIFGGKGEFKNYMCDSTESEEKSLSGNELNKALQGMF